MGQKVRYERINEKLSKYGLYLSFGSLNSTREYWLPSLQKIEDKSFEFKVYSLYGVFLNVKVVGGNRVKFYVRELNGINVAEQTGEWFKLYRDWINEIDKVMDYCNNLDLKVPKYVDGGYQKWEN